MKKIVFFLFLAPFIALTQEHIFVEGIPKDLENEKIIILKHEKVDVTANKKDGREAKYLYQRQTSHNKVIQEANLKLKGAALSYPYGYAIASKSTYESLLPAGYKYVLQSSAYSYDNLKSQPEEGELIVYEYFIHDVENNLAYKVFELDEMKIYDFKLIIKKLNKAIK